MATNLELQRAINALQNHIVRLDKRIDELLPEPIPGVDAPKRHIIPRNEDPDGIGADSYTWFVDKGRLIIDPRRPGQLLVRTGYAGEDRLSLAEAEHMLKELGEIVSWMREQIQST